jgi:4-alpha-glucanotransferase
MGVGAPPDAFNAAGQDWGLPPFDPWQLRARAYRPWAETLRAAFRHSGGLRVDHVMGLFRLFWVPSGSSPAEGAYVRYPASDLLDVLALESHLAGAYVVGEDLGTVEPEVREELSRRQVLSYRLWWFEDRPPSQWPELALAAVTTHDLPTVAGLWTGRDPQADDFSDLRGRLREKLALEEAAPVEAVVEATYRSLADAPSMLVTATIEDAIGAPERPNLPGMTVDTNWSLALPATLEEIEGDERPRRLARLLGRRGQEGEGGSVP